jgi:hypothetical protein
MTGTSCLNPAKSGGDMKDISDEVLKPPFNGKMKSKGEKRL